jgi:predicted regulator of Ras-like GTPase activity (Roadblock/LC7/MglB family)
VPPTARYARSGDLHIAYIVEGEGPVDVVWVPPWISQCEHLWTEPSLAAALDRLTEISAQVEAAVIFDVDGGVVGSTLADEQRARRLADAGRALLDEAQRRGQGERLVQLEVALQEGSVFLVRDDGRAITATTAPGPTVGVVFYDLKSCLRDLTREEPEAKPKAAPKKKAAPRKRTTTPRKKKADEGS